MSYSVILIKLLPESFLNDFLDGNLYLNTPNFFGEINESDQVRFDADDGIDKSLQVKEVAIAAPSEDWTPIGGIISPITFRLQGSEKLNILCMCALTDQLEQVFDKRNLAFGSTAVIIADPIEFIHRVKSAATALNKSVFYGPVEYVDKSTYHGNMGPFKKYTDYNYQREFRFVLTDGIGIPCRLNIGDIRDITAFGPAEDIPKLQQSTVRSDA
jgi:hypothetical protein